MSSFGRAALVLSLLTASLLGPGAPAQARRLPPRPACLEGTGAPSSVALEDGALRLCVTAEGAAQPSCYLMDLTTGKLQRGGRGRVVAEAWKLELGEGDVTICPAAGGAACKTVRASGEVDPGLGLTAELSGDGAKVALAYLGDAPTVEVFAVASGAKLLEARGRSKGALCISGSFAGDALLVAERDCGADAVAALWIAGPDGKRVADAGGGKAFATARAPAHLSGEDWAFASAKGDALAIQDVKTGKVKKKLSLGKKGAGAMLAADAKQLVAAFADKRLGEVAVVDLTTYKVRKLSAPRCAK